MTPSMHLANCRHTLLGGVDGWLPPRLPQYRSPSLRYGRYLDPQLVARAGGDLHFTTAVVSILNRWRGWVDGGRVGGGLHFTAAVVGPSTGSAGGRQPSLHYGRCFDPQPVARVGGWRAGWREPPLHFGPCFDPQPVVWVGGDLHGSLNASSQLSKHFPIGTSSLPCLIPTRFLYMCSIIGFFSLLKCVLATLLRCACGSTVSSLTYVA